MAKDTDDQDLGSSGGREKLALRDRLGKFIVGPGRKKGSQNKVTKELKLAVMQSFDEVGGVEYLKEVALENPTAYMALLGKTLPREMSLELQIAGRELLDTINARRQQLVDMQTIESTATEVTSHAKRRTRS